MANIIGRMGRSGGGIVGRMGGSTSKILEQKINNLDDRVDAIITTPVGSVSAQEIIDARGGEATLGANIIGVKSQLAEKATNAKADGIQTQVNNLVLGAVGPGNNAEVIQARGTHPVLNDRLAVVDLKLDTQYNYKGLLDNTKNLDDVMKSGIYFIPNTMPINTPPDLVGKTYILRVDLFNEAYALQVAYDYSNPSTFFSRRVYTWANPKATEWVRTGGGYQKIINNTYDLNTYKLNSGYYWVLGGNQPINTPLNLIGKAYIVTQELFHEDAYAIQSAFDIDKPQDIYKRWIYYYGASFTPWILVGDNAITKPLTGKKLLTLGDSVTYGAMSTNHYQDKIAEITGATIVNAGYSGSKYALILNHTPWNEFSFYQRSIDYSLTDIDYIFVMYGINDFNNSVPIGTIASDEYTVVGAIYKALTNLMTRKPTLKIIASTPIFACTHNGVDKTDLDTQINAIGKTMPEYISAIKQVFEKFRVPIFDGQNECGINQINQATFLADMLHPNNAGNDLIGIRFANFIKQYV